MFKYPKMSSLGYAKMQDENNFQKRYCEKCGKEYKDTGKYPLMCECSCHKKSEKWNEFEGTQLSMHLWTLCCEKYGSGGTPKASKMYDDIKKYIVNYKN